MTNLFLRELPAETVRRVRERATELEPSQIRVLAEIVQGKSGPEIAEALDLKLKTVDVHAHRITQLLGCSRTELIRIFCAELSHETELFAALIERAKDYSAGRGRGGATTPRQAASPR